MNTNQFPLSVKDHDGKFLGFAESFGEAKDIHQVYYNETDGYRAYHYAGLECGSKLKCGYAYPVFYKEGTV